MKNWFEVDLSVTNLSALREFAQELNPDLDESATVEELVNEICVNPSVAPLDAGYEITTFRSVRIEDERYRFRLEAQVFEADKLVEAARKSYVASWSDESWSPENLGEALYEHVLASNASPSPDLVGFTIDRTDMGGEPVAPTSPSL